MVRTESDCGAATAASNRSTESSARPASSLETFPELFERLADAL